MGGVNARGFREAAAFLGGDRQLRSQIDTLTKTFCCFSTYWASGDQGWRRGGGGGGGVRGVLFLFCFVFRVNVFKRGVSSIAS